MLFRKLISAFTNKYSFRTNLLIKLPSFTSIIVLEVTKNALKHKIFRYNSLTFPNIILLEENVLFYEIECRLLNIDIDGSK
jgi:hypothetical protein